MKGSSTTIAQSLELDINKLKKDIRYSKRFYNLTTQKFLIKITFSHSFKLIYSLYSSRRLLLITKATINYVNYNNSLKMFFF